ncbi:hypothetical protein OO009_02590 [Flavobacteriaceae bacterium KMM 6897]|nr:hypothetical protein [Flavobacteriaceae bacterium KMM 6897]
MRSNLFTLLIKGGVFVTLMFFILMGLSFLFTESKLSVWNEFYNQEKNTVDILILGNSHANSGLDLDIIDAKTKGKSVSLATRGQNIYQSYYVALEAYNYQAPEILIIENFLFYERLTMDAFVNQDPTINDYMKRYLTFEGKKFGDVKIKEARAFFKGSLAENMFPTIKKHSRWTDIGKIKRRLYEHEKKGKQTGTTVLSVSSSNEYNKQSKFDLDKYNILPEEENALQNIIDLAKEKGTKEIILLTIPFYKKYRNKIDYNSLDEPLKKIAKNNEGVVEYIDLNRIYPNWDRTYFSNDPVGYNQHLNYKGKIVASNYIIENVISKTFNKPVKINKHDSFEKYFYNKTIKDSVISNDDLLGNLEKLNKEGFKASEIVNQRDMVFILEGWMAIKDKHSTFDDEKLLILSRDSTFIYFSSPSQISIKERKDVTKYYKKDNKLYNYSGFIVKINSEQLEKGKYTVYMALKNKTGEVAIKNTHKTIDVR